MSKFYLFFAIVLEVVGTVAMKTSEGFTKPLASVLVVVCYALSLGCLTLALKHIEVSTAYAVWSGVGTVLIATIGILWFKEPVSMLKIGSIALIILGVVGLNLSRGGH